MAGDWIKMRVDIADDPAVIGIANRLGLEEDSVVGKLHRLWAWADRHTTDGNARSVTESWVDRYVCCPGFAMAMSEQGWLRVFDWGVEIPNFGRHNGKSGKARALTKKRVESKRAKDAAICNATSVTPALPEKRREEKSINAASAACATDEFSGVEVPAVLDSPEFRTTWSDWLAFRREARLPKWKPATIKKQLANLARAGPAAAVKALEASILHGWKGVFPEKFIGKSRNGPGQQYDPTAGKGDPDYGKF